MYFCFVSVICFYLFVLSDMTLLGTLYRMNETMLGLEYEFIGDWGYSVISLTMLYFCESFSFIS